MHEDGVAARMGLPVTALHLATAAAQAAKSKTMFPSAVGVAAGRVGVRGDELAHTRTQNHTIHTLTQIHA